MKIKFTSGLIVNVVIGLALALMFLSWGLLMLSTRRSVTDVVEWNSATIVNNLKPINQAISDSIPYYQHTRLEDSIAQLLRLRYGDGPSLGGTVTFGPVSTYVSNYCDTCTIKYDADAGPSKFPIFKKPVRAYLLLSGWKIKPAPFGLDSTVFHVEHNQPYLRKQLVDSTYKSSNGLIEKLLRKRDIAVPFSYNREHNCMMIPIDPATKNTINIIVMTIAILGFVYYMFYVIGGFVKFLIDVSRGRTFTLKNIRRLKIIGISLIALEALILLINLCMPLIFHKYFTSDIVLNEKSWVDSWEWFVAGIAFLLLYKAFCSGKKIKDEQDLVI